MKTSQSLFSAVAAALLILPNLSRAEDPVPPTPPGGAPPPPAQLPPPAGEEGAGPRHHGGPGHNRLEKLKEELNLTPDQIEKIKPIFENERAQMKSMHDDTTLTKEQKHEKMRESFKATIEQIKPLLTPDQQAKLKDKWEKRKEAGVTRRSKKEI